MLLFSLLDEHCVKMRLKCQYMVFFVCCMTIWVRQLSALINWWRRRRLSAVWRKSPWIWGQITSGCFLCSGSRSCGERVSLAHWHKAREAELSTSQAQRAQTSKPEARWVPGFFFFSFLFANSCARWCQCDGSWQLCVTLRFGSVQFLCMGGGGGGWEAGVRGGGKKTNQKDVQPFFCAQVVITFSVGKKKKSFILWNKPRSPCT